MLVRRVVGHRRLEGTQQLERLCQLYAALRLYRWRGSLAATPTSINHRPSESHLRRVTCGRAGAHAAAMTNRSPQLIDYCDGAAWAARVAISSRSCSNNAIRSPCWRRIRYNQAALVNGDNEPGLTGDSASSNTQELDTFLNSLRLLLQRSEPTNLIDI